MLQTLNAHECNRSCIVGSGGASVGYLAHGTATDYMYETLHVPVAMTWEIYGDEKAHYKDCFRMFNPLTRHGYEQEVRRWSNAVLRTVLLMADHPAVQHLHLRREASQAGAEPVHGATREGVRMESQRPPQWRPYPQIRGVAQLHTQTAITHQGVQKTVHRGLYRPSRNLMSAAGLLVMTLVLWCLARRFLQGARTRRRLSTDLGSASTESSRRD
jgi:hypothetical protein